MERRDYGSNSGRDWHDGQSYDRHDMDDDQAPRGRYAGDSGMDRARGPQRMNGGRSGWDNDRPRGRGDFDRGNVDRGNVDRGNPNRGYRGGHFSSGSMGNRGALGSNFLGPTDLSAGELIGGGSSAGFGAGGMYPNFDASMDGYSGTMGDETDLAGYSGRGAPQPWREDAMRANHSGRGSKNYKRSDTRIEEDVHEALMRDRDVDATDIDVRVASGEVTLEGEVEDRAMRRHAEECVEHCAGVTEIHNNLRPRRGLNGSRSDMSASTTTDQEIKAERAERADAAPKKR